MISHFVKAIRGDVARALLQAPEAPARRRRKVAAVAAAARPTGRADADAVGRLRRRDHAGLDAPEAVATDAAPARVDVHVRVTARTAALMPPGDAGDGAEQQQPAEREDRIEDQRVHPHALPCRDGRTPRGCAGATR